MAYSTYLFIYDAAAYKLNHDLIHQPFEILVATLRRFYALSHLLMDFA
jgi:hypothetical protein